MPLNILSPSFNIVVATSLQYSQEQTHCQMSNFGLGPRKQAVSGPSGVSGLQVGQNLL